MGTVGTGEWPNPIMSWTKAGAIVYGSFRNNVAQPYTDFEPTLNGFAGSPGLVKWWPSQDGLAKTTATSTMDFL